MNGRDRKPVEALVVAVPETAGSALYGMVDVLSAAGNIWQTRARTDSVQTLFRVRIVALGEKSICSWQWESGKPWLRDR